MEELMTLDEVAGTLRKPVRWVRERLIKPRLLRCVRLGGNSVRVEPAALREFVAGGGRGFVAARGSGGQAERRRA